MSYEGFDQILCENGHYHVYDCWEYWAEEEWLCPDCGAKAVWSNMVDVTNGSWDEETDERIDGFVELQLLDECKCEHCGSILERRYKIPTEEDIRRAKPWRYENE